jgi:hypothetical protein
VSLHALTFVVLKKSNLFMLQKTTFASLLLSLMLTNAAIAQTDGGQPFESETNVSNEFPTVTITFKELNTDSEGQSDEKPLVKLTEVSAAEYQAMASKYKPKVKRKHKEVVFADSTFTIKNKVMSKTFDYNRSGETITCNYVGFMPKLNLHIVESIDMHNETSSVTLIDRTSGISFDAAQCSDYPAQVLPSPKSAQMAMYSSSFYDGDAGCIFIVKASREKLKESYSLINRLELDVKSAMVHSFAWINENEFGIAIGPEKEGSERQYLRVTLLN